MAAITVSTDSSPGKAGKKNRYYGTSAANQADTLTSTAVAEHKTQRLCYVTVSYSAAPTQTGITVTLDSGLGSAFDTLLTTGSANVQNNVYLPDGDLYLFSGDAIVVLAAAAGGVITGSVVIVTEDV